MPHPTPNKVTSWLRVKKYSWGRNPVVGVKILDMYLRCSSRCRCPGNLPEMRWAWLPWQQADPQWRQCSQTGVCQTHRFASEHSKTGWGRHSLKSCLQGKDIILIGSTWMQSGIERETTLDIRPFSTRSNLQGRQKLQKKIIDCTGAKTVFVYGTCGKGIASMVKKFPQGTAGPGPTRLLPIYSIKALQIIGSKAL